MCPTLSHSHAACHLLWHHQLLTLSLATCFYTQAGFSCAFPSSPASLPWKHISPTRFSLIGGVMLSLQWLLHTSDMLCELLYLAFQYYRHCLLCFEKKKQHTHKHKKNMCYWLSNTIAECSSYNTAQLRFVKLRSFQPELCHIRSFMFLWIKILQKREYVIKNVIFTFIFNLDSKVEL